MKATTADIDTLARTVYGEARGESVLGMIAVAHVILNRVKAQSWFGKTIEGVCRKPWQFSCWNDNDPNLPKMKAVTLDDPVFQTCYYAALSAITWQHPDSTSGSCHYHTASVSPDWSEGHEPVAIIGVHKFFNDVK